MNYPDSVHFLYSLGNEIKTAKLGLDRVALVLQGLDGAELLDDSGEHVSTSSRQSWVAQQRACRGSS